jgi:Uma2 family endonuclease
MAAPAKKRATYADLEALPENMVGEIVFGVLHAFPRPRLRHANAATEVGGRLRLSFGSRFGEGPGGWIILVEPELHFGEDVVVPDVAGWRRERLPELPDAANLTLAPDWLCEVLSPGTRAHDLTDKRSIYLRERVRHLWFVDAEERTLEVQRWSEAGYVVVQTFRDDAVVRAEPFEAIEIPLAALWQT